jgi:hypothetical protein
MSSAIDARKPGSAVAYGSAKPQLGCNDVVQTILSKPLLSGSTGRPAFPSRPGSALALARSKGDERRGATRSHAQRSEHGEDGEHRTFPGASTRAPSSPVMTESRLSQQTESTKFVVARE